MSFKNWRLELKKQIAIAIAALGTASVTPAAMSATVAASTVKPNPVVVTNPVTIANPVSTVTVGNTVPVTGTVNIGTLPSVTVDTTTPLNVKSGKVYSTAVNVTLPTATRATGNYDRVLIVLPAPAVLETIAATCNNAASGFSLNGILATIGTSPTVTDIAGNNAIIWNGFRERFLFPSLNGVALELPPTPINVAFQSNIWIEVQGDLLQPTDFGMACIYNLTFRELN
jgi:hypothetical protein